MTRPPGSEPEDGPADLPATQSAPPPPKPKAKAKLPETQEAFPWVSNHEIKKEANPFTDPDWRMAVYAWAGLVLRIMLVTGALFSVYQYLSAREEKRVERSLELVELWEKPEYQAAQKALKQRLVGLAEKFKDLLGSDRSEAETKVLLSRLGQEAMTEGGGDMPLLEFQDHFDRILYILNRLSFCVESNLCSREVADAYFRDYAQSFWDYFAGYIAGQRKAGDRNFARPIEEYLTSGSPTGAAG